MKKRAAKISRSTKETSVALSLVIDGIGKSSVSTGVAFFDHMLESLKVKSIRLITNNPKKIEDLTKNGISVTGRIPHIMQPNQYNRFYLETKANKSGHLIDFSGIQRLPEQADPPVVKGMDDKQIEWVEKIFHK